MDLLVLHNTLSGPVQPLELNLRLSHTEAVPEDLVDIYCGSEELQVPLPQFSILVNGRQLGGEMRSDKLAARLALTESHFLGGRRGRASTVTIQCQASRAGRILANTTRTITRAAHQTPSSPGSQESGFLVARHQASSYSHILLETRHSSGAVIVGKVSGDIMENLNNPRASSALRLETSEEPIEVLRILGYFGYNVVAMANTPDNRIIWTLTRIDIN